VLYRCGLPCLAIATLLANTTSYQFVGHGGKLAMRRRATTASIHLVAPDKEPAGNYRPVNTPSTIHASTSPRISSPPCAVTSRNFRPPFGQHNLAWTDQWCWLERTHRSNCHIFEGNCRRDRRLLIHSSGIGSRCTSFGTNIIAMHEA
jgi:hypothetical protein